ncbi:Transmembrane channel-like protein 5 like protein [Argiope bruennichi]|uniref:Transmembrane channel-like protein 5 like protein n=1 Tax=Argiope bruennichi TaxID=94029 RepID=A0A8T0ECQ0_ARGBR|nr:Transmembrane channel-like protein 5 like protein [Argiope bruennichi]
MATPRKSARKNEKEQPTTNLQISNNQLEEDEYGYVDTKGKKASSTLLQQLPSRHLEDIIVDDIDEPENLSTSLRRRDSHYRKVRLRNASLNYHKINIGAQKIYEILNADSDTDETDKMKTLREMHQSLTVKRQVKERLDADKERKIATQALGCWIRFKLAFFMTWHKFWHELKSISYFFEPWHSSIKTIQGQFGSGVASYFIFLRWLLYINMWNFFTTFCFVVIPQLIVETRTNYTSHPGNYTSDTFHVSDLLTGSGWFSDSLFYFGHYSNKIIEVIPNLPYNMPLAYLLTIGINAVINLIAVSSSITATYQKNYVDTAGGIKNVFCNKIFSAWDYAIETESAAQLQKQAFCNGIKELIYMKVQEEKTRSVKQKIIQRTLIVLISLLCLAAIGGVGFLTYYLLEKKALKVDVKILQDMTLSLTVTSIAIVSYFVLKYATRLELYLSHRLRLYLTMIRVVTLRIVMLGIIAYFWIFIFKPPRNMKVCYETELGKEIYRLILVNFLIETLIFTLIGEYGRKLISLYFSSVGRATFDVAYNTLDLIYYQTLAWIAIFCVPLGSFMIIIILILLFYIKKSSMAFTCKPPIRSWSVNEAQTFYLVLTFVMFFFSAVTVGYSIFGSEPSDCGPYRDYQKTQDIVTKVFFGKDEQGIFTKIITYITSPGVLFAIFCALGLVVYYMRAQAKAHISVIKKIREQLILASKDKVFLLKLFDEAFLAHWQTKSSTNVKKDQDSKQSPHQRNGVSSQHEVFNEGYTEYNDHPLESPIHKKFSPSYIPAKVPINIINHENVSPGFNNINNISARSDGYRSPIASFGKESPLQMRRGSPYPVHQHGFRHLCDDSHKQTHTD